MTIATRSRLSALLAAAAIAAAMACAPAPAGSAAGDIPESRTAHHFETLRAQPDALLAFLREMPKGGDLHSHLVGDVSTESLIAWAAASGLCVVRATVTLGPPPCDAAAGRPPASGALTDPALRYAMLAAWSMVDWPAAGPIGHDHFFSTFDKFMPATAGHFGAMLAEAVSRAAENHVSYLELMVTPDDGMAARIGDRVGWNGDAASTRAKLEAAGLPSVVQHVRDAIRAAEADRDRRLACGTPQAAAGCAVTVRYLYQALRALPLPELFAQLVLGFSLADDSGSPVVGLNLVQAEDGANAMKDFDAQMQMLRALRPMFPRAHLTLHAGELTPALVPAAALRSHIRDAIEIAGAERIGHGVDILGETGAPALLEEMARRHILVEICLTSNDLILGVRGPAHPLAAYLRAGVPAALATDDEGVERTNLSDEFLKAAVEQRLGYVTLKALARNSLQYAFVDAAEKARLLADWDRSVAVFESRY